MKAPREYRRWINALRSRVAKLDGKRNGAIGWVDDPGMENLLANSKRRYQRRQRYGEKRAA